MTLYLFNRLIRVATYLRRSGNKTIRVKSFQRKVNPLLNMPPGKIKLNKPDGHIGKEVVIDTDGTLREALTELSDFPFVPKLIASKGDRLLIERPLITKDDDLIPGYSSTLKALHERGYISKKMNLGYSANGYHFILDPVKATREQIEYQADLTGTSRHTLVPQRPIDLEKEGYISPLELVKPKYIESKETLKSGDVVSATLYSDGEISFSVNSSISREAARISGSPIEVGKAASRQIKKIVKEQKPNTILKAEPSDSDPKLRMSKRQNYKKGGLSVEGEYNYLWGISKVDGSITGEGISSEYIKQISTLIDWLESSVDTLSGKKIRDIYKWE